MAARLDRETIERLRKIPAERVVAEVRRSVFASGSAGSEDFLALYDQLVDEGVLTWEQIERVGA